MSGSMMMVLAVFILGWFLASTIGTWAYFAGRTRKIDQ